METQSLGFRRVKVIAVSVTNPERAKDFYGRTLGLPPAMEDNEQVGFLLGDTILMLKDEGLGPPTTEPNPRITIEVEDAQQTEDELRIRDVIISDPLARYGDYLVGGFCDSEGNKLWFCGKGAVAGPKEQAPESGPA